jgi:tetratricopeptide (TPR) repeat protein
MIRKEPAYPSCFIRALCVSLVCVSLAWEAAAHDGIHEQIEAVTRQIERNPAAPQLYLQRGELHRLHRDWAAALADYAEVARLEPRNEVVEFCRGRMLLEAGRLDEARTTLDRHLARNPTNGEALLARARVLSRLALHEASAADYTRAIERYASPKPDLYVERAHAEVAAGRVERALGGLDEGIRRIGPLVALELPAVDLELRLQRYDRALSRLEAVSSQSPRKETWLARRAEILEQAGRVSEAVQTYSTAMKSIEALPLAQRRTPAMTELETRLRTALVRLASSAGRR